LLVRVLRGYEGGDGAEDENLLGCLKSEADAARSERERRKNVGDAQRRAHAVARATARRPTKLREIPRIKRRAGATPGTPVVHLIPARGFAF